MGLFQPFKRRVGGWLPTSLPLANLGWWDARDVADGSSDVAEWDDRTGIWRIRGFGGMASDNTVQEPSGIASVEVLGGPLLVTDVATGSVVNYPFDSSEGITIGFVAYDNINSSFHRAFSMLTDAVLFIGNSTGKFAHFFGNGSAWNDTDFSQNLSADAPTSTMGPGDVHVIVVTASPAGCFATFNGTSYNRRGGVGGDKLTYSGAVADDQLLFFGDASTAQQYKGFMNQIVVGQGFLGTDDRQRLEGYLAQTAGIIDLLPLSHPWRSNPI